MISYPSCYTISDQHGKYIFHYVEASIPWNSANILITCLFFFYSIWPLSTPLQIKLETLTRLGNLTHSLYRSQPDADSVDTVIKIANPSCYDKMLVFDIESDNTIGNLGMPGEFHVSGNKPCIAPLNTEGNGKKFKIGSI